MFAATHMMYCLMTQAFDELSRARWVNLTFFQLDNAKWIFFGSVQQVMAGECTLILAICEVWKAQGWHWRLLSLILRCSWSVLVGVRFSNLRNDAKVSWFENMVERRLNAEREYVCREGSRGW